MTSALPPVSRTLISSSLVSKKWALSTRRHLFSNITISVGRGIRQFSDLFHSPHVTITPFIKSLSLVVTGAQCSTDGEQRFLIQLLSKLGVVPFHTFSLEFREQDGYMLRKDPLCASAWLDVVVSRRGEPPPPLRVQHDNRPG